MNPPWIQFPNIPQGIGWRMGTGGSYKDEFYIWFSMLTKDEKLALVERFPEPEDWKGFFQNMIDYPNPID